MIPQYNLKDKNQDVETVSDGPRAPIFNAASSAAARPIYLGIPALLKEGYERYKIHI